MKDSTNETLLLYFLQKETELQHGSGARGARRRQKIGPHPEGILAVSCVGEPIQVMLAKLAKCALR